MSFAEPAWAPRFTSAAVSPPAASDTPCRPEHGGGSGGAALCSSFTLFLFSPELVSLLESNEPSEAGDLCFNFCSQLAGSLLLLADLLLFRFLFFWMVIHSQHWPLWWPSGSPLLTRTSAPEIWKMSFLWQPKNKLSVTEAWKRNHHDPLSVDADPEDEPTQLPRDLELGCLLSHLQIFFFPQVLGTVKTWHELGATSSFCSFPWNQMYLLNVNSWRWKLYFAWYVCKASRVSWERQMTLRS